MPRRANIYWSFKAVLQNRVSLDGIYFILKKRYWEPRKTERQREGELHLLAHSKCQQPPG